VDVNQVKVDLIAAGKAPWWRSESVSLTAKSCASGAVSGPRAPDVADAIADTDVSMYLRGNPVGV